MLTKVCHKDMTQQKTQPKASHTKYSTITNANSRTIQLTPHSDKRLLQRRYISRRWSLCLNRYPLTLHLLSSNHNRVTTQLTIQKGGNAPLDFIDPTVGDGFKGIRYLSRSFSDASKDGSDWSEPGNQLSTARWYASVQTMPDGSVFVASGSLNGLGS